MRTGGQHMGTPAGLADQILNAVDVPGCLSTSTSHASEYSVLDIQLWQGNTLNDVLEAGCHNDLLGPCLQTAHARSQIWSCHLLAVAQASGNQS